jgi:hypothetical protein
MTLDEVIADFQKNTMVGACLVKCDFMCELDLEGIVAKRLRDPRGLRPPGFVAWHSLERRDALSEHGLGPLHLCRRTIRASIGPTPFLRTALAVLAGGAQALARLQTHSIKSGLVI